VFVLKETNALMAHSQIHIPIFSNAFKVMVEQITIALSGFAKRIIANLVLRSTRVFNKRQGDSLDTTAKHFVDFVGLRDLAFCVLCKLGKN
jgi:hypothetical protein